MSLILSLMLPLMPLRTLLAQAENIIRSEILSSGTRHCQQTPPHFFAEMYHTKGARREQTRPGSMGRSGRRDSNVYAIKNGRDEVLRRDHLHWPARTALATLLFIIHSFCIGGVALAKEKKPCLDSAAIEALSRGYKENCKEQSEALRKFLLSNKVTIAETGEAAHKSKLLLCNFSNDPNLKQISDPNQTAMTEDSISAVGVGEYVRQTIGNIAKFRTKYNIDGIENSAKSTKQLPIYDLKVLIAFGWAQGKYEVVASVIDKCR